MTGTNEIRASRVAECGTRPIQVCTSRCSRRRSPTVEMMENRVLLTINLGLRINDVGTDPNHPFLEGNSGYKDMNFTVGLATGVGLTCDGKVTVDYTTEDGTGRDGATANSDYIPVNGTLTFNPHEALKTITVKIIGDTTDEYNEKFYVKLRNIRISNSSDTITMERLTGTGQISNDDAPRGLDPDPNKRLAWGSYVSSDFKDKVFKRADDIDVQADWLMAIMARESAETFSPSVVGPGGRIGLIQFDKVSAAALSVPP